MPWGILMSDAIPIIQSLKTDPYMKEVLAKLGSDYDEDGVPYWEK